MFLKKIYFGYSFCENKTAFARAWEGLSDDWGKQWVNSWTRAEKVMFLSHYFKT